jgi:8-amino-7-oxononanoate synthase
MTPTAAACSAGTAAEHAGVSRNRIVQCVTLSKAFGVYGGAVLASSAIRKKIISRSRVFMGTTPLPPPLAQGALAALKILRREPARRRRLFANAQKLRTTLQTAGWEIADTPGPIIRLPMLSSPEAAALKKNLLAAGICPPFLKYGAASRGAFRFVISSEHTREQLTRLARVLADFKCR